MLRKRETFTLCCDGCEVEIGPFCTDKEAQADAYVARWELPPPDRFRDGPHFCRACVLVRRQWNLPTKTSAAPLNAGGP